MNIPLTQSKAWQKLQSDLGRTSFYQQTPDFTYLAILESTPVGKYLYLPCGPLYRSRSGFSRVIKALTQLAREQQVIFIRIEPRDPHFYSYAPANAVKSTDLSPKETWILSLSSEGLTSRLPSRLLRYHKSAAKKGITIETSHNPSDLHHLLDLQRALASKKGINTFSEHYLATELSQPFATLYLAKQAGTVLAAGLVFDDATTRYNLQGAQSEQGRKLHATGILTIQLILDAAAKHLKLFDFWGIAPVDAPPNHPWAGFTAFKKTFAGSEVDYAGTYDLVLSHPKYRLYQAFRALNRLRRKL